MTKLGEKEYICLIADTLTDSYGSTLREYNTDITLAEDVLEALRPYLLFHPLDITEEDFERWKGGVDNR